MNLSEMITFLDSLPKEKSREYEVSVTALATDIPSVQAEGMLLDIIDGTYSDKVCYNAFYCLNIVYRRAKDYPKLKELLEKHTERFDRHITFDHLVALYNLESDAIYDYTELLKKTHKDAEFLSDNAGFVHLFADVFATIYEKGGLRDKEKYIEEWYAEALEAVNSAIDLDPSYAKYYCTKARILCINKDFSQALYNVDKAIGFENSRRADYALRISTYQYHKMMIYTEMRLYELEQRMMAGMPVAAPAPVSEPVQSEGAEDLSISGLENYQEGLPFVFVSYSHRDSNKIRRIVRLLIQKGVRLWCDVESIPTGEDYTEHIAAKIVGCKVFMPMISSNSVNSEYVRKEIGMASRQEKKFFPILLEDIVLSPGMDLQINSNQRVDWLANTEEKNIEFIIRDLPREVFISP